MCNGVGFRQEQLLDRASCICMQVSAIYGRQDGLAGPKKSQ